MFNKKISLCVYSKFIILILNIGIKKVFDVAFKSHNLDGGYELIL